MEDFEYINKELGTDYTSNMDIDWKYISCNLALSEDFIEKYINNFYSNDIVIHQILSEDFIEKHKEKFDSWTVTVYQKLSEKFIIKYSNKLSWNNVSKYQKLSEDFIESFQDKVNWSNISAYQKLSESFIEKFQNKIDWDNISTYQKLSEEFIKKHKTQVNWFYISKYQKISDETIKEHDLYTVKGLLWQYKPTKLKRLKLIDTGLYEWYSDYFIAYKAIRSDRYSFFNFQYQYLPGGTYESNCDCTGEEDSFGLNVGTYKFAKNYLGGNQGIIVKCKVYYKDIGRIVHDGEKIRCFKITILE